MKILIIHATAGAGHRKAAEAVFHAFKNHTTHDVQCVDALDYTSPFYKNLYQKSYSLLISRAPWLWGFFFWLCDVPFLLGVVRILRRFFNALNAKKLHRFLREEKFDCIVSTHFFPNEVASYLKRKGEIASRLICVVTDYDAHSIWVSEGIDQYAVACPFTKNKLLSLSVPEEKIFVTGIPTDEKFSKELDKKAFRESLGLHPEMFTVLIATGSFGIGPIEEIIEDLSGVQCVVVCGHNEKLFKKLSDKNLAHVRVCAFVDNMHEWMAASDAMITKPGGLSISEALVRGLALIFFSAIPGQETNNIKVLKTYGVGVSGVSILDMAQEIKTLEASQEYRLSVKEKINALARPLASRDIINLVS